MSSAMICHPMVFKDLGRSCKFEYIEKAFAELPQNFTQHPYFEDRRYSLF